MDELRRWRFWAEDFDGSSAYLDRLGGPNGDEEAAEFLGTRREAEIESERRAMIWEDRNGTLAAKIVCESRGKAAP